jgi:signal transduction histidine kinase
MMPKMDGYAVCKKLKQHKKTQNIPIIFLTAQNEVESEMRGLALGAVDYISKPISPPIVLARIQTHLRLHCALKELEKTNQQLRATAKLREQVESITQHDLKSPLNAIISIPDLLLEEDNISEKNSQLLKILKDAGYVMLDMINRSLDLYKMEVGTYQFSPHPIELVKILRKVISELTSSSRNKNKTVSLFLENEMINDDDRLVAVGEELLSYSLFSNLLRNAFEASPKNTEITILLYAKNDPDKIKVYIKNTGAIPEKIRGTFFDKFISAEKLGGTGLGTYSAQLCAKTQKGHISFQTSTKENSTTLQVCLPKLP